MKETDTIEEYYMIMIMMTIYLRVYVESFEKVR